MTRRGLDDEVVMQVATCFMHSMALRAARDIYTLGTGKNGKIGRGEYNVPFGVCYGWNRGGDRHDRWSRHYLVTTWDVCVIGFGHSGDLLKIESDAEDGALTPVAIDDIGDISDIRVIPTDVGGENEGDDKDEEVKKD